MDKRFENKTLAQFVRMAREFNIDVNSDEQVNALARQFGLDVRQADAAREVYARHTVGAANQTGLVYKDGPFTWMDGELISDVTFGGNPLMQWIPFETMEPTREETVSHLSWVAPSGWQPQTQSYSDYLDSLDPGQEEDACDPVCITGDWAAFSYNVKYGEVCTGSGKLTTDEFGMKQHRNVVIPAVRGPNAGINMATDADWARARAAIVMEQHLDWNLLYGVHGNFAQWDGLYEQMTPGYVTTHFVGNGAPHWAEPLVLDGSVATDCGEVLLMVKNTVRVLRRRIRQHNFRVANIDMAIVLPSVMWARLMDCIACGGMTGCGTQPTGYTIADWRAERERLSTGGVGYGVMEIDGEFIPVIPLEGIAVGGVDADGNNVVIGDIFVLTRRANGMNVLAHQMFDWNQLSSLLNEAQYNTMVSQGGIFRETWIAENDMCFQYRTMARGRNLIRMYPLQARIASVSMVVDLPVEYELETAFLNEYFYGALDDGLLTPVGGTF